MYYVIVYKSLSIKRLTVLSHVEGPVLAGGSRQHVSMTALGDGGDLDECTLTRVRRVVHDEAVASGTTGLTAERGGDKIPRRRVAVQPVRVAGVRCNREHQDPVVREQLADCNIRMVALQRRVKSSVSSRLSRRLLLH